MKPFPLKLLSRVGFIFLRFALKKKILNVTVNMLVPELKNVNTIKSVKLGCLFIVFLWISQHPGFHYPACVKSSF